MQTYPSEKITINGRTLSVRQTGGDLPAVVLVHGFTDSGLYWSRLAADMADRFNVIMPDLLGHGHSDPLGGVTTVESYADDVVGIMDHYGIDVAGLGGHSMGGVVVNVAGATYPSRFNGIMIEDPAWIDSAPEIPNDFLINLPITAEWKRDAQTMRGMTPEEVRTKVKQEKPGWHPDDWSMYISDRMLYDMAIFEQLDFGVRSRWKVDLAKIEVPVLLVTGERALGGIVDDSFAGLIMSIAQKGRVAKIAGAGHGIHREQYEAFRDAVIPFYESLDLTS